MSDLTLSAAEARHFANVASTEVELRFCRSGSMSQSSVSRLGAATVRT